MTGPTTVGSIDAKLTLDDSQFNRTAETAKATARELGALSPEVKVDANVGPALAKMAEVEAIERQLEATNLRLAVTEKGLNQEQINSTSSAMRLATVEKMVGDARRDTVTVTKDAAGATDRTTDSIDKNTESAKRNTSATQGHTSALAVLIGLAPAMLAAAAPIAAGAAGLGAAFGVMGAAGVAAFAGIKQAMAVGDTVGNQYAAGVAAMKQNLDNLAGTAANGMLSAFNSTVNTLNSYMPFLNQTMGTFSSMLGNIGGTVLRGVLSGLQQMNPLLEAGGVQLSHFVSWLMSFSGSNGFQDFIRYAIDNLPAVMSLIEHLVTLAGNIITAFAPLGPVVLTALNGLVTVLNSLPLPMLAGLVTTATTLGVALQFVGSAAISGGITAVAEAIGLTGVMANLAVPVVGILLAAVAGLGVAAASTAAGQQTATQATVDYTQALKEDNDAIGKNTQLMAAKALSDSGAFRAATELGISQKTLTDATLGNSAAQQEVADKIGYAQRMMDQANQASGGMYDTTTTSTTGQLGFAAAIDKVNGAMGSNKDAIAKGLQTNKDLAAATDTTTGALSNQQAALQAQAGQYGATVQAYQSAQGAQEKTATDLAQTTLNMQMQSDAAGLLKAALDGLNGKALSAAQAQNAFDSQLANMGTHVDKVGNQIQFTTNNIGSMDAASVALRGQLNSQVAALQQTVEANGGLSDSTGKAKADMEKMRQQIIDNAVAHGVDRDAVTAYVDNLLTIPKTVPPTKLDIDKAAADAAIEAFKQHLASINSRTVTVTTNYVANGKDTGVANTTNIDSTPGIVQKFAGGGQVANYLAGGGFPGAPHGTDTQAAWLTPGEIVMNTSAVASLGAGNLLAANRTGQWPTQAQQGSSQPVVVNLVLDGQIIDKRTVHLINGAISSATNDARYRRVGV